MAADGQCSLPASWRPVTLTHVEYPTGDLSGHLLAYLSLSPVFVIVGFVTLIIFKRELHTISFLGGLALNEGVNWLIKHVIQEPRPCGGPHMAVGTKYGMPSSHSQFMWFFSVYSFLFLYLRPISEFFLIRDTSLIPNVLWFEYTVTRAEARVAVNRNGHLHGTWAEPGAHRCSEPDGNPGLHPPDHRPSCQRAGPLLLARPCKPSASWAPGTLRREHDARVLGLSQQDPEANPGPTKSLG
ncbi:dolichyldiphosphatase 1 isoform X4 [Mirounga angustirostris]|uniref:dolichyldiphosphatase 1 isoform X4 n=1 Tax=Mirounga angustirostris TaxID=9716 RepID=UPI00313EF6CC